MLWYAFVFLIIAIVAGFFGVAGLAAMIAKILFVIFLVLFVVSLVSGRSLARAIPTPRSASQVARRAWPSVSSYPR